MPQRRSFAPLPMNEANVNAHGREASPPNLQPAAQPLPPRQPQQPQAMPGAGAGPGAGAQPQPGMSMGARLPASIPLSPMQPQAPQRQPMPSPGAGISPMNAETFTRPAVTGTSQPSADAGDPGSLLKLLALLGHNGGPDANA